MDLIVCYVLFDESLDTKLQIVVLLLLLLRSIGFRKLKEAGWFVASSD